MAVSVRTIFGCDTTWTAGMNQWTVPLEWNGGMEYWNGLRHFKINLEKLVAHVIAWICHSV